MDKVIAFPAREMPAGQLWELVENLRAVLLCNEVIDQVVLDRQVDQLRLSNFIIPQSLRG